MWEAIVGAWQAGRCDRTGVDEALMGVTIAAVVCAAVVVCLVVVQGFERITRREG